MWKESIHCLRRDKDGSISIRPSDYGLMSNLNDLITDSFFADSIFGAYAEQYANTLIADISETERQWGSVPRYRLEELRRQEEAKRQEVVDAKIDTSSIEKLREHKLEDYNKAVQKAEENLIDEFVSSARARASIGA